MGGSGTSATSQTGKGWPLSAGKRKLAGLLSVPIYEFTVYGFKIFQIATTRRVMMGTAWALPIEPSFVQEDAAAGRRYGCARALRAPFFLWASSLDPANRTPLLLTRAT